MTTPGFGHVLDLHEDRVLSWDELLRRNADWHATHDRAGRTLLRYGCGKCRGGEHATDTRDRVPCECAANGHAA